jgi:hypothetical protein
MACLKTETIQSVLRIIGIYEEENVDLQLAT